MSQYKSAIRSNPSQDPPDTHRFRQQARQLQELFPNWTNDDLILLLNDVGGDVQIAATRITEGTVEVWGEVSRKKDKKTPTPAHASKSSVSTRGGATENRGTRGGRGGRGGGPGRGGAAARGRSARTGATNGHIARTNSPRPSSNAPAVNGQAADSTNTVNGDETTTKQESPDQQQQQNSLSGWGENSLPSQTESASQPTIAPVTGTWGAKDASTAQTSHAAAVKQASKPATSKLSWAQIARPHEKPAPPPAPSPSQPPPQPSAAAPLPPISAPEAEVPSAESKDHGWEEPTTVEAPTWDDEPQKQQPAVAEAWPPSTEPPTESVQAIETPPAPAAQEISKPEPIDEPAAAPEPVLEPKLDVKMASPAPVAAQATLASHATSTSSPKFTTRPPVVSHRSAARHKVTDQPVTMPLSFGTGIEKVGMQFGSLSLAGDGSLTVQPEAEAAPTTLPSESASPPQAKAQLEPAAPVPPATAPAASTSLTSVFQQQQTQQPQQPSQPQTLPTPVQTTAPQHTIPTSMSQPIPPSQTSQHAATASPLQPFAQQQNNAQQQPALANNTHHQQQQPQHHQQPPNLHQQPQHLQHLPQQVQQNHSNHHSYTQHGLPTHIDPSQSAQGPVQQPLPNASHSSYFRQAEATSSVPYFHTPTPPAAQSQESSYGSFAQLGAQAQHQQPSHLGAFASSDYGYPENSRAFYESYAQQSNFGGRNPLVHDEGKGISGSQQPANANLPPSSAQGPQQHASQNANQTQPAGAQGPQQNYPPPLPYYYTHAYPQNQYYGSPYSSGYVPQPFVKYPAMFQPGPPGPGSSANPAAKQSAGNVGVGVQPQTNPYNQGLYQQSGYDDYQPHPHHSQHQHQHTHSLGLSQGAVGVGSGEYGKQLYGAGGQGGMQGFMGLGGQSAAGGAGPNSNAGPRSAASPEAAYKPYASKDVPSNAGRGAPVQQGGQGQPQSQGQGPASQGGPQGQSFYGGNRFGSGVGGGSGTGGVGGAPQQTGHHQQAGPHLGYPQGGNEPNFYGYQPRQQQGYWQ